MLTERAQQNTGRTPAAVCRGACGSAVSTALACVSEGAVHLFHLQPYRHKMAATHALVPTGTALEPDDLVCRAELQWCSHFYQK